MGDHDSPGIGLGGEHFAVWEAKKRAEAEAKMNAGIDYADLKESQIGTIPENTLIDWAHQFWGKDLTDQYNAYIEPQYVSNGELTPEGRLCLLGLYKEKMKKADEQLFVRVANVDKVDKEKPADTKKQIEIILSKHDLDGRVVIDPSQRGRYILRIYGERIGGNKRPNIVKEFKGDKGEILDWLEINAGELVELVGKSDAINEVD